MADLAARGVRVVLVVGRSVRWRVQILTLQVSFLPGQAAEMRDWLAERRLFMLAGQRQEIAGVEVRHC